VMLSERVVTGLVVDHSLEGGLRYFPEEEGDEYALVEMPAEGIVEVLRDQVKAAAAGQGEIAGVGVGVPGLVRNGVVEEAPNLPQLKGTRMAEMLGAALRSESIT